MEKVIILEGNMVERKGILDKIKNSLADYELFIFDKQDNYDYVSQMVTEISCFEERRLFIIKHLPKMDAPTEAQSRTKVLNHFKKLFPVIPLGNIVVFDNVGLSAESFFKEVRKCGRVYKFNQKISKSDAYRVVNEYFQKRKIRFDREITSLIVDSLNLDGTDVDVDKLYLLIKKFYHYIYGKTKVTKQDVYAVCSSSRDFIIWTFYNMLDENSAALEDNKQMELVMGLITEYLENAKYFQHEATMTIQSMVWRYGLLLMVKNGVNNKMSLEEISRKISNINKLESSGRAQRMRLKPKMKSEQRIPQYSSKMIGSVSNRNYGRASLSCYTLNQLLLIYYVLVKTLIKIRSGCTDAEIKISLYLIVSTICGEITKKNTIDGVLEHKKVKYGI